VLFRSKNVGDNLCIHPMIKAAALFDDEVEAHEAALPVYQVKEFWPTITIGGAVFTPGFLAMLLADNWRTQQHAMADWSRMALYYAATRGMNRGSIRVLPRLRDGVVVRYVLSETDQRSLSIGLGRLGELLFAAGARAIYPSVVGGPILRSVDECRGFLKQPLAISSMALSTVHAFSSCPMGENPDFCATDSFGQVRGLRNLYINDASLLPDSPGVNPQGTTMAIALRNVDHFMARSRTSAASNGARVAAVGATSPRILVTGAPGWLATRFLETLLSAPFGIEGEPEPSGAGAIRCLAYRGADPAPLTSLGGDLDLTPGDVTDRDSLRAFFANSAGATLFHIAGLIHPARWTRDFGRINIEGTRNILEAAIEAGVKRIVAVSSNSPAGCNPDPEHVFDERSPNNPYMGYGRSKAAMEALIMAAHASGRIETVILRPPWFYGPHQPPRQTLFFTMIKSGRFPILGDGTQKRSMAYVDNICQALLLAARTDCANGETYWIADERPYTVNEIVDTVAEVLEQDFGFGCSKKRMHLPSIIGDAARIGDGWLQRAGLYQQKLHVLGEMNQTIACSIEKAKRELGYAPRFALRDGMRASIAWCLANGFQL
jgi:nucleoside-diphosphate-sugar epimerase